MLMEKLKKEILGNGCCLIENNCNMKHIFFLFISIILVSCSNNPVPKPDKLLSNDVMKNIIYDIAILQAAVYIKPEILADNNIKSKEYIYKKYKIDSVTYFQNYKYYASDINSFKKIYEQVNVRIQIQRNEIDTLLKNQKKISKKDPTYKAKKD